MSAQIESFASLRTPGWHALGTVFSKPVTTQELMDLAHLQEWNLRTIEIDAPDFNMNDSHYYFVVRDNAQTGDVDVLHVAGQRYTPLQNEALFDIGDGLQASGFGRWETAGSLRGGRTVFGSMSIDREVVLDEHGANDVIKNYLLLAKSHDGTLAVTAANTPVRVVCQNTLDFALVGAKQRYSLRQTASVEQRAAMVAKAMTEAHGYIDRLEETAESLIDVKVTDQEWYDLITAIYPKPEDAKPSRALTMWTKKFDNLESLRTSPTNAMWDGTAWGVVNVLVEDLDWFRTGRGENAQENLAAARSGFDPAVNAIRNNILTTVGNFATA